MATEFNPGVNRIGSRRRETESEQGDLGGHNRPETSRSTPGQGELR